MKKVVILMLALMAITSISGEAKPKIEFDCGKVYDWGVVRQKDSPLKADIKLFNNGDDTLKIDRVKPMCGCTTAPLSKKLIAPGDSALLKVTLNVEHYEGEVNKKITITSNAEVPEFNLDLKAVVYQPIKLFPNKYLNFSQMYIGTETVTKLVINNLSGVDIKIKDITKKPEDLTINLKPGDIIQKDSDFVFIATVNPISVGPYTCNIDIFTDNIDAPEISLSGWGRADSVNPNKVNLNDIDSELEDSSKINPNKPVLLDPKAVPIILSPNQNMKIDPLPLMQTLPDSLSENQTPKHKIQIKEPQNATPIHMNPIPFEKIPPEQVMPVEENNPIEQPEPVKKK